MNIYMFLADCHGLQSVSPYDQSQLQGLDFHVHSNAQRWPVWGTIELDDDVYEILNEMIATRTGQRMALEKIKVSKFAFPVSHLNMFKRRLEKIPNDELDPYYTVRTEKGKDNE